MPLPPCSFQDPPIAKPAVSGLALQRKKSTATFTAHLPVRMEGNSNITTDLKRTNASLQGLIDAYLGCLSAFEECLDQSYAAESMLREMTQCIQERIRSHKESFTDAKQTQTFTSSLASHLQAQRWGVVTLTHTPTASVVRYISLAGGEGEPERLFKFVCDGQDESSMAEQFVDFVTTVFEELDKTQQLIERILRQLHDLEELPYLSSPAKTIDRHIRVLGQYNDVKDIGQQLIGLIADNHGVPVGTLYQDSRYGVSAPD